MNNLKDSSNLDNLLGLEDSLVSNSIKELIGGFKVAESLYLDEILTEHYAKSNLKTLLKDK